MGLSAQIKRLTKPITGQFRFLLRIPRLEIDLVLLYSVTAALLFILLRLQMLRRIVSAEDRGWQHLHGQLASHGAHYYLRAAWVVGDYLEASWAILHQDMFYLAALTILCLLVCTFVSSASFRRAVTAVYFAIVFISLLFLSVNVELGPMYSTQLDYSLLKFSGLMTGTTATLMAVIPRSFMLAVALICATLAAAPCAALFNFYQKNAHQIRFSFCTIIACGLFAIAAAPVPASIPGLDKLDSRVTKNSLAYFFTSLATGPRLSGLGLGNLGTEEPNASGSANTIVLPNVNRPPLTGSLNNVLVIVLESVGAEYFELLSANGLLPTFSDMMSQSVYYKNTYAAAPISNVTLVAMLTSTGPLGNYKLVTLDYPRASFPTSYEKFKSKGFVTGFFWSNDSEFLGIDKFLQNRGIDLNQDYRQRVCPESSALETGDELLSFRFSADTCTAASLLRWIDENRGKSFFATLWTEQTHYPYAASSSCMNAIAAKNEVLHPKKLRLDADWPRYAAALCDTDRMMSKIVSGLRDRQQLENTFIIVVGDHGEGFGQHGSFVHGSEIFEDEVRVPLLISAGHALTGRVDARLASHLDIAPTIAAAFGILPADRWEGHDLLDNRAPRRVHFYAGWGNYKMGYREADRKYIYDVVRQKLSSYDLSGDPRETMDVAGNDPGADAEAITLIKKWYLERTKFANTLR